MRLFPRAPSRHGTVRSLPLRSPSQRGAPICKMTCGFACLFRSKACHYAPFSGMTRPAIASNCGNPCRFLFAFCTDQGRSWRRVSPPSRKLNEFATSFIPSRSFGSAGSCRHCRHRTPRRQGRATRPRRERRPGAADQRREDQPQADRERKAIPSAKLTGSATSETKRATRSLRHFPPLSSINSCHSEPACSTFRWTCSTTGTRRLRPDYDLDERLAARDILVVSCRRPPPLRSARRRTATVSSISFRPKRPLQSPRHRTVTGSSPAG